MGHNNSYDDHNWQGSATPHSQTVTDEPLNNFNSTVKSDTELYGKYFHEMLKRGIYPAPAQFEALFVSTAHSKEDLDRTIQVYKESFESIIR